MPGGIGAARLSGGLSMVEGLFSGTNYLAAKRLLDATALRQEAIAGNLANVETPGYRRMDVAPAFEAELKQAIGARDVAALKTARPQLAVDATARSSRQDGNTVILESELLKLNQNSVEHAMETQMITGNLVRMRLAITGRG